MGYQLPKLKHETSERDEIFEQPLFVDVITRDENTGEDKRLENMTLNGIKKNMTRYLIYSTKTNKSDT